MIFAQQLRLLLLFGVLKGRHCIYMWLSISRDIDSSECEGLYIGIESICSLNLHLTKPLALSASASIRMKSGSSCNIVEKRETDVLKETRGLQKREGMYVRGTMPRPRSTLTWKVQSATVPRRTCINARACIALHSIALPHRCNRGVFHDKKFD